MCSMTDEGIAERAKRSAHISLIFEAAVKRVFSGYAVEMIRPEGGARALLHIRLVSEGSTFALGWASPVDGSAELYTLGRTLAQSKRSRGRELAIPPLSYSRFLETAQRVLEDFGMLVTIVAYTKDDDDVVESEGAEDGAGGHASGESGESGEGTEERRRTPTLPWLGLARES
jgi:hypothetical protein